MLDNLDPDKVWSGVNVGLGVLAVYFGSVAAVALTRTLGQTGSIWLLWGSRRLMDFYSHSKNENWGVVNVTLNTVHEGHLKYDTIVSDKRLADVWVNDYLVRAIKAAGAKTTETDPVLKFTLGSLPKMTSKLVQFYKDHKRRVEVKRESDYSIIYNPVISLIAERFTNAGSLAMALKKPVKEYSFVLALTFEKVPDVRARHFRIMMINEDELLALPDKFPKLSRPEHGTRYKTLLSIRDQYKAKPEHFGVLKLWDEC